MSEPIYSPGPLDAPVVYTASGTGQIVPLACYADYDGTGAAGDFKPALVFTSQAGHKFMVAATDETIAAGASASVSWFPRVGAAAATAPSSGAAWFFASRQTNFTVATNNPQRRVPWTHVVTSDSSVFTVTSGLGTNDTVHGNKAGIYIAHGQAAWASPQTYPRSCLILTDFFGVSALASSTVSDSTVDTTAVGNPVNLHDSMIAITQSVPGEISFAVKNWDVANHIVTSAFYAIVYLPNSTLVT